MGIIYCLTSPSNKKYVGQTKRKLNKRLSDHRNRPECVAIYNAIQKYGFDSFKIEVLCETDDEDEMDMLETKYIAELNTLAPNGYNIRTGGAKGSRHCAESRERMRLAKLGEKNHNFGKPRTPETRIKISLSKKGEKHHFYGKTLTYKHKLNLSKAHKKDDLPMYLVRIKARPKQYCSAGYAVANHPKLKNKYFTSKKYSDEEKLNQAMAYLNSTN